MSEVNRLNRLLKFVRIEKDEKREIVKDLIRKHREECLVKDKEYGKLNAEYEKLQGIINKNISIDKALRETIAEQESKLTFLKGQVEKHLLKKEEVRKDKVDASNREQAIKKEKEKLGKRIKENENLAERNEEILEKTNSVLKNITEIKEEKDRQVYKIIQYTAENETKIVDIEIRERNIAREQERLKRVSDSLKVSQGIIDKKLKEARALYVQWKNKGGLR